LARFSSLSLSAESTEYYQDTQYMYKNETLARKTKYDKKRNATREK